MDAAGSATPVAQKPDAEERESKEGGGGGGENGLSVRLARKIEQQAQALMAAERELQERQSYTRLCEKFVVALDSTQPLPLNAASLHAARARQRVQQGQKLKTSRHTLTSITRQFDAASKRVSEQADALAEMQQQLEASVLQADAAHRGQAAMQRKLADVRRKLRDVHKAAEAQKAAESDAQRSELVATRRQLRESERACEEHRIYVDILQGALRAKAEDLGLDADDVAQAEQAKADVEASKAAVARTDREREALEERLRLETLRWQQAKARLEWYEPSDQSQSQNQTHNHNQTQGQGRSGSGDGFLRLRKDNETLVDYVRDTVDPLKRNNADLQQALSDTADALDTAKQQEAELTAKLELARLQAHELEVDVVATEEARATEAHEAAALRENVAKLEDNFSSAQAEIADARLSLREAEARAQQLEAVRQDLADTQNALRLERHELVAAEEKRKAAVAQAEALTTANADLATEAAAAREATESLEASVESLTHGTAELTTLRAFRATATAADRALANANANTSTSDDDGGGGDGDDSGDGSGDGAEGSEAMRGLAGLLPGVCARLDAALVLRKQCRRLQGDLASAAERQRTLERDLETAEKLRKRLERDLELHMQTQQARTHAQSERDDFDGDSTVRNMRSRLEQAAGHADHVAQLKQDLERASHAVQERQEMALRLEEQLEEADQQLRAVQEDADLAKRLCHVTLKGTLIRYRNSSDAVRTYFGDRHIEVPVGVEAAVTPICELLESVLESCALPPRHKQHEAHRDLEMDRTARTGPIGRGRHAGDLDVDIDMADDESDDVVDREYSESYSNGRRPKSPASVRVQRDGTIHVSTFEGAQQVERTRHRSNSNRSSSSRNGSRSGMNMNMGMGMGMGSSVTGARPETPLARRYRQQLRAAQEKFRRAQAYSSN